MRKINGCLKVIDLEIILETFYRKWEKWLAFLTIFLKISHESGINFFSKMSIKKKFQLYIILYFYMNTSLKKNAYINLRLDCINL